MKKAVTFIITMIAAMSVCAAAYAADAGDIAKLVEEKAPAEDKPEASETPAATAEPTVQTKKFIVRSVNGSVEISADGKPVIFPDAKPFIDENGRTQIPVRAVTETLDAAVNWNDAEQVVTIKKDDLLLTLKIGSDIMTVSGRQIKMDTSAVIIDDRTYVPLRYIAEALGMSIEWESNTLPETTPAPDSDFGGETILPPYTGDLTIPEDYIIDANLIGISCFEGLRYNMTFDEAAAFINPEYGYVNEPDTSHKTVMYNIGAEKYVTLIFVSTDGDYRLTEARRISRSGETKIYAWNDDGSLKLYESAYDDNASGTAGKVPSGGFGAAASGAADKSSENR